MMISQRGGRGANRRACFERASNVALPAYFRTELALPRSINVDNGSAFISKAKDRWAYENWVKLGFSPPGKPTDNAKAESFNSRFWEECRKELRSWKG